MITIPEILVKVPRFCRRKVPNPVAAAPRAANTTVNPRMNNRITLTIRPEETWPSSSCAAEYPDIIDRYPGSRGSTQGEMNEMMPAPNAMTSCSRYAASPTFSNMSASHNRTCSPILPTTAVYPA